MWAKLSELKAGDKVILDNGFDCHEAAIVEVKAHDDGLYFDCKEGRHYLAGQADDGEHCVGIRGPLPLD